MDLYLITGFLGAGKTTFLKNLIHLLQPAKLYLIINEFGAEGVDGALLRTVDAELEQINNGSIFCACRLDRFEAVLQNACKSNPDAILVESSGLTDPTNVQRVLQGFPEIRYRGSICLADAGRISKVFDTAIVTRKQLAVSSLILLNKTDAASDEQIKQAKQLIKSANPFAEILCTQFGRIDPSWFIYLHPVTSEDVADDQPDITLQKAYLRISPKMDRQTMLHCLRFLSESTFRMKGFVQLTDGRFLVDCTASDLQLCPWNEEANNRLVLLAGKGMPLRKTIRQACDLYGSLLQKDTEQ